LDLKLQHLSWLEWPFGRLPTQLFAAAAREDRGVPILLMLGTAEGDVA